MLHEPDDATLWRRVQADDETAFALLYARHHRWVERTVSGLLADVAGADVHTVTADVFHTAWRRRRSVEVETSLRPWLRGVAVGLGANERRRVVRQRRLAQRARSRRPDVVEGDHADHVAGWVTFLAALRSLPPAEALVARLAILHDLPATEIADRLRIPVGTVKSRLHRARTMLRRHLDARRTPAAPAAPTCEAGGMEQPPTHEPDLTTGPAVDPETSPDTSGTGPEGDR